MDIIIKKILPRAVLLILPFFVYYICVLQYRIEARKFTNDATCEYGAIDKSNKTVGKRKVIFGESIGLQLYPLANDGNKDYYTLITTRPVSIVGVYVLLQNFIAHNNADSLVFYYIVSPTGMDVHLQDEYTYNHFLKPFYTSGNMKYFTQSVNDSVRHIPYWYFAQVPFIKITDWA